VLSTNRAIINGRTSKRSEEKEEKEKEKKERGDGPLRDYLNMREDARRRRGEKGCEEMRGIRGFRLRNYM